MIGKTFSHYRITEKLGEGGMGVVYKAEDLDLKVTRALKFLPPDSAGKRENLARLEREARSAARLEHPAICPVHEIGRADGHTFIVMSYLEGQTLEERLARERTLSAKETIRITIEIADALNRAHQAGVTHRDLKPANIMMTPGGHPVLMDFGLALEDTATKLTRDGVIMGTAAYMSPEQVRGEAVDGRTDIWALGVMVHEMLTGKSPFRRDQAMAILNAIQNDHPSPLTQECPEAPPYLEIVVDRCLEKKVSNRYPDIDALLQDLVGQSEGTATRVMTARFVKIHRLRRRKRFLAWIGAAAVLAVAVVAWQVHIARSTAIDAIAVLPFLNLSGDPEQEYFADGMTEQLITELQLLGSGTALRVIGRTSVMRFKESDLSLPEIAEKLGVDAMVEASVRQEEGKVLITAKLIRAQPEQQIWADTFEREIREAPGLHASIAGTLFEQIGLAITAESAERVQARAQRVIVPEAYEAYLQGRHFFSLTTVASARRAIASYETAIRLDPNFARAYAGLAEAANMFMQIAPQPPSEYCESTIATARKAIELDPSLADGYAILSDALAMCGGSFEEIGRLTLKALELSPSNPTALLYRAQHVNIDLENPEEGLELMKRAEEADPFSPFISVNVIWQLAFQGQVEKAEEQYRRTLELDPGNWVARWALGFGYVGAGRYEEAVQVLQESLDLNFKDEDGSPEALPQMIQALAALDRQEEIKAWKSRLETVAGRRYIPSFFLAFTSAGLGLEEESLDHLEASVQEGEYRIAWWQGDLQELLYAQEDPSARFLEIIGGLNTE